MKMIYILLILALTNCAGIPITSAHWARCETICKERTGIMEMCNEYFRGPGCHCNDDQIFWLDELDRK